MDGDMDHNRQFDKHILCTGLVGGFNPSEEYYSVVVHLIPNIWKNKTCSKPPTSYVLVHRCRRLASGQNVARTTEMDVDGIAMERRYGE